MRDTELCQWSLGLGEPWFVERVVLAVDRKRVNVWVEQPSSTKFGHRSYAARILVFRFCLRVTRNSHL